MASGYHGFSAGEKPPASTLNDYLSKQSAMVFTSASDRDTQLAAVLREGMLAYLSDVNMLTIYSGSAWSTLGPTSGALTAYTPVILQSNSPTFTITRAAYMRTFRWIQGWFNLSVTSAGTAANNVYVSLPVTALGTNDLTFVGNGKIYDASTGNEYVTALVLNSTTAVKFQINYTAGGGQRFLGTTDFTAALAAGDAVVGRFAYEAAGDA